MDGVNPCYNPPTIIQNLPLYCRITLPGINGCALNLECNRIIDWARIAELKINFLYRTAWYPIPPVTS